MEIKMKAMQNYYFSRLGIAVVFGALFHFLGAPWWVALLACLVAVAGFAWAPRSGRYVKVKGEGGQISLAHDENTRMIADKAARNGFVFSMVSLGSAILYFWRSGLEAVPLEVLQVVLLVGVIAFAVSDIILRRVRLNNR